MEQFYIKIMEELENEINALINLSDIDYETSLKCRNVVLKYYHQLKDFVIQHDFNSNDEEIFYFKKCKPLMVSEFIFYDKISKMMLYIPTLNSKKIDELIDQELKINEEFINRNSEFINYYRSDTQILDDIYFLRETINPEIYTDISFLDFDNKHTTYKSNVVAQMFANIKMLHFLENKRSKSNFLEKMPHNLKTPNSELYWSASKVALIELIYALYSQGAINNGNVEIKKIVEEFEIFFNVKLNDPYRCFSEIKQRKKMHTSFLDSMKTSLNNLIDEQGK